jgi:2,4-dienoyl-CoA reductase (NADPH2)
MNEYPHLFSPITVRGVRIRNRICMAPQKSCDVCVNGDITPRGRAYYEARAKGGTAMICYGETFTQYETAFDTSDLWLKYRSLDLHNRTELTAFTKMIKRHGAVACIELNHDGAFTAPFFLNGKQPVSASAIPTPLGTTSRAMSEEEIEQLCEDFADAAKYCKDMGFDMVLIHGGHGWLLTKFLSRLYNYRTDRFGGRLENRARICRWDEVKSM